MIVNEEGHILGFGSDDGSNHQMVGLPQAVEAIKRAAHAAMDSAHVGPEELAIGSCCLAGRIGRMRLFSFEKLSLELLTQATALWFAMTCKQHFELVLGNIGAWSWHADRVSMPLAARPTGKSGPFRLEAG